MTRDGGDGSQRTHEEADAYRHDEKAKAYVCVQITPRVVVPDCSASQKGERNPTKARIGEDLLSQDPPFGISIRSLFAPPRCRIGLAAHKAFALVTFVFYARTSV